MKRTFKSLVLVILIIGSIYQIITLWFDNVSDRNFFYSFIENATDIVAENTAQTKQYMIQPRQLGVYLGASDKDFTVVNRLNPDYEGLYGESLKAITSVMKKGRPYEVYDDDVLLWEDRGIVFCLGYSLSKADLAVDLDVNERLFNGLKTTRTIGIIPANDKNNLMKVYFIDEESQVVYMYSLSQKEVEELNDLLNSYIDKTDGKGLAAYISTFKNDIDLFKSIILLPLTTEGVFYSDEILLQTPFVTELGIDKAALEPYVNGFFTNFDVAWQIEQVDGIVYGDESVVVKYSNLGVLEYSRSNSKNVKQNISEAFNVAQEFISKDILLSKELYYLEGYNKSGGDGYTFYYGYAYDSLPLQLEVQLSANEDKVYPMEITVENGRVKKYNRILINGQDPDGLKEVYEIKLETALNEFLDTKRVSDGEIDDMYLSYVRVDGVVSLKWILHYKNVDFIIDH